MRIISAVLLVFSAATSTAASAPGHDDRNIPLFFIPNRGQAASGVQFMAKGSGLTAYFLADEVDFRAHGSPVRMRFEGAAPARIEGAGTLPGAVNFLSGPPSQWRTGIPIYGALAYRGLYPGIDMSYGISGRNLKSEFTVAPGGDPRQIRIRYLGAGPARINAEGALLVPSSTGTLRELPPVAWQTRAGERVPVQARFELNSDGSVGFALGTYDPLLPLVVDPVLSYSTLLGGSGADAANAIAVDTTGAVYIAGFTESFDLPTVNPAQSATGGSNDAFVAKLSASGNALIYCTYLGGRGDDRAFGIAIDSTGAAYVTGSTQSSNFPIHNAYQASLAGGKNAFVAKLTPTGNSLVYSTYLGGNGSDAGNGIAVDSSGNAYVVGDATSTNFPVNSYQRTYHGGQDAFVAKLNAAGSALTYSTYLGGGNTDHGAAIAIDSTGAAFVTGSTYSSDFPMVSALQGVIGGGQDAFIARLNPAGSALIFSTFLGGSSGSTGLTEAGQGIAVDASGNAYIAGVTPSSNFPLLNPEQATLNGATDAFVVKISGAGVLIYSTYLGGSGMDCANAIAVDSNGYAYLAGYTYSTDFPVVSTIQPSGGGLGTTDAFVAKLAPAGNSLVFSTYLGGNDSDTGTGVGIDPSGNIYVTGWTLSSNFPTLNPYQSQNAGNYGAFVTKYVFNLTPANLSVSPNSGNGSTQTFTFQYSDANGSNDFSTVGALFNTSSSLMGGCAITFNRALNTLALLTDAGAQPASPLTPGSGTAQNSQCVLNDGASSVAFNGNILSLTLALSFQPSFVGLKNIYMQAANPYQTTAWQPEGTWTVPPAISMTVIPSSGNATQQTFAFQYTDSLGATDLTTVAALFNTTSSSVAAACMVTYNRAQNSLALATDAGVSPAGTISPGSGSQQNSQCILNGASSSVSVAGSILTLNLAMTFQPPFAGAKNVYMDAVSNFATIPWTQEGTWSSPPVVIMSVSPASGSATQQNFAFQVSDSTGATDLTAIGALVNSTATTSAACAVIYNRAQNTLALLTDAGAQPASTLTPGSGTAQNSQCILNGASSSVVSSRNLLTMNLALTFQPAFSGSKNIYVQAANPFETLPWIQEGTWTPLPVIALSASPNSGGGAQQKFTLQYTDSLAATDLTTVGMLINASTSTASACAVIYNRAQNTLALLTDAGAQPASTLTPGSGTAQNSQCTLVGSSSTVTVSANAITLNLQIAFLPAFAGAKNLYMNAVDPYQTVAFTQEGTWTTVVAINMAVTPVSGSGTQQIFSLQVSDSLGATDLTTAGLLVNSTPNVTAGCAVIYNRAQNTLALLTDAGAQPASTIAPGSGTAQNSQCILSGALSTVTSVGNLLTVNVALTFQPAFSGLRNVYADAGNAFQTIAWTQEGTWISPPLIATVSSPSSGGGLQQTFNLQFTDSLGATDLSTVGVLFNSSVSTVGACAVIYTRAQNSLALLTDAGAQPASTLTPGNGSAQNSQCVLNGAASSVTTLGNTLTLNLALTFQPAFTGIKNIYMEAIDPYESVTWQSAGTWETVVGIALSVTPTSALGLVETFNLQVSDSIGATDLVSAGLLVNSSVSTAGACAVIYNRAQNTLSLLTDSGGQPASTLTPGAGTAQNSQCVLNGATSSVTAVGNLLTVNLSFTFQGTFTGIKNVYAEAANASQSIAWTQEGTWTLPPTVTVSITPSSGFGAQQTFSAQVIDSLGGTDVNILGLMINATSSTAGACAVIYNRAQNTLALLTDAGAQPASAITPGSGSQSNSQCTLNGAVSSATISGNALTVNAAITFLASFVGTKNLYVEAATSFQSAAWIAQGTWIAAAALTTSVTPTSGSATQQVFSVQAIDTLGAADLSVVGILIGSTTSTSAACVVIYNRAQNTLALLTDAGALPVSTITPGSGTAANSQCTLTGSGSTVTVSGNNLTVNFSLSFQPAFGGAKNVYTEAGDASQTAAWILSGAWTSAPAVTMSVTPSSGSGTQQTFNLQVSDALGATDLSTVGLLINSTASVVAACAVTYNRAQNTLMLFTDSGAARATTITPGSGSQQSSQCTLSGAGSSVTILGNILSLNLSMVFASGFAGAKNIYSMNQTAAGVNSGWQTAGSWTALAAPVLSIVSIHSGSFTQGQTGATYSLTVSNQAGAGLASGTVTVSDTLPTGLTATSIAGTGWNCAGTICTRGDTLAAGASYPTIALTVNVAPNASPSVTNTATVSGPGATSTANDMTTIQTVSTTGSISIWSNLAVPQVPLYTASPVTLGVKFRSDVAGTISALRFYKGAGNNGTHIGLLYDRLGNLMAQATFTGETASGWQQVSLSQPVAIAASATYVVALFTTSGFAYDPDYFTNAGVSNAPLHALQYGVDGPNGVFLYGPAAQFPTNDGFSQNYWTDVVFTVTLATPNMTITSTHAGNFTQGQAGAAYTIAVSNNGTATGSGTVTVSDTLPAGLTATSLVGAGWTCSGTTCTRSDTLAAGSSYPSITLTVTVASNAASSVTNTAGVAGVGAASTATDVTTIQAASPPSPISIWSSSTVPQVALYSAAPVTLGVKFRSDAGGTISALRFYKGAGNNGTHIGLLYDRLGNLMAQATFTGETASGWQQVSLSQPVAIAASATYVVALFTTSGFAYDPDYFTNAGVSNAPLHALQYGVDGPNGVYLYGSAAQFPTNDGFSQNYWADVVFTASQPATISLPPVLSITASQTGAFTQGETGAVYTITVSNSGTAAASGTMTVSDTLPTGLTGTLMAGAGWICGGTTCTRGDTLAPGASYPAIALTVNVAANAATTVTNIASVSSAGTTAIAADVTAIQGAASLGATTSIWSVSAVPQVALYTAAPVTLGVKFRSDVNGTISALRFYKGAGNNGTHIGLLYDATGLLLAQVTFTGESSSGWQQMSLAAPVSIAANTTYVAAYFTTSGFAYDPNYFANTGASNAPLHALQYGVDGANGVYLYGSAAQFPASDGYSQNYWIDIVFSAGTQPVLAANLTITASHVGNFAPGQKGAAYAIAVSNSGTAPGAGTVTVSDLLPTGLTAASMSGSGWSCGGTTCTRSDALAAASSYPTIALTVNVAADAQGSVTNIVTVSNAGETSTAADVTAIQSPGSAGAISEISIWNSSAVPQVALYNAAPVTLGLKFRSDVNGTISALRFYKGAGNNGVHIGLLYDLSGNLLAQAAFTGETASGWQQMNLAAPVAIAANTTYVAAYFSTSGFAYDPNFFANAGVDNVPLHALRYGVDGPNGVFIYASMAQFPANDGYSQNYWIDAVSARRSNGQRYIRGRTQLQCHNRPIWNPGRQATAASASSYRAYATRHTIIWLTSEPMESTVGISESGAVTARQREGIAIPFNKPYTSGRELEYIGEAIARGHISGDGPFSKRCQALLAEITGCSHALLTTSCTDALEMAALLLDIAPGDEVIIPSFTFVSTVNAFALRGARIVFADVRRDTLNLDEGAIDSLISDRTRAIVPVHYAGVGCEMETILHKAAERGVSVVEDNAHGLFGSYRGRKLGTFGQLATLSFHETKNISCGEGGALLINDPRYFGRAEILREKGTNRSRFFRGQVDKYTWVDIGSSFLPSDILGAFLLAQLETRDRIQAIRKRVWSYYASRLISWASAAGAQLPYVPSDRQQSYHMFYMVMPTEEMRDALIDHLKAQGIQSVFHYVPLHLAEMGRRAGGYRGQCPITEEISPRLVRLPFYNGLSESDQERVVEAVLGFSA